MFTATLTKRCRVHHKSMNIWHEYDNQIKLTIIKDKDFDNGFLCRYQFEYQYDAFDKEFQTAGELFQQDSGAQRLIDLMKDGYKFDDFLPETIINALIEPAFALPENKIFSAYSKLEISQDNLHIDDSETYYWEPFCNCNAPLIETSYYMWDNQPVYRVLVHVPTTNQIVNRDGHIVREYRGSVLINPIGRGVLDFDDLQLVCSVCGKKLE